MCVRICGFIREQLLKREEEKSMRISERRGKTRLTCFKSKKDYFTWRGKGIGGMLCIRVDLLVNVYSNNFRVEIPDKRQRKTKNGTDKEREPTYFLQECEGLIIQQAKKRIKNKKLS